MSNLIITFENLTGIDHEGCAAEAYFPDGSVSDPQGVRPVLAFQTFSFDLGPCEQYVAWRFVASLDYSDNPDDLRKVVVDTGKRPLTVGNPPLPKCDWTITATPHQNAFQPDEFSVAGVSLLSVLQTLYFLHQGQPTSHRSKGMSSTKGNKLEAHSKKHVGAKSIKADEAVVVPITVRNESSDVAASGKVTMKHQPSGEIHEVPFGRLLPGQVSTATQPFANGFPDLVGSHFLDETHPGDDWSTFNVSTSGGFESIDIHLTN
jgi:hypothetical protein